MGDGCRGRMPKMRWLLRWDDGSKVSIVYDIEESMKDPCSSMIVKCFVVSSGGGHLQLEVVGLKRF